MTTINNTDCPATIDASEFPPIGTKLTAAEAIAAYDSLEDQMVACVFGGWWAKNVGMGDVAREVTNLAFKYSLEDAATLRNLLSRMWAFESQRNELSELDPQSEFEVGVDGHALVQRFLNVLGMFSLESAHADKHAPAYRRTSHSMYIDDDFEHDTKASDEPSPFKQRVFRVLTGALVCVCVCCSVTVACEVAETAARIAGVL